MYGRSYKSKKSAGAKRKQYRKRATSTRRRTTMRKKVYRKNTPVTISAEKKYIEHGFISQPVGQYTSVGGNAYYVDKIHPIPTQGLGQTQRIGQKIFVTGAIMDVFLQAQTNLIDQIRYKYYVVRIPDCYDNPITDMVAKMFDPNPFATGIFDWHSNIDPENQSQFKIMAKGQGSLAADNLTGQRSRVQFRKYLKLGFEMKWDDVVLQSDPTKNQWRIVIFADHGVSSSPDFTGFTASFNFRIFYLDN